MSNRNITLSLPEEDLKRAKIVAIQRGTSLSQLLTRMIKDLADQETGYAQARARSLARLEEGRDLGTGGQAGWSHAGHLVLGCHDRLQCGQPRPRDPVLRGSQPGPAVRRRPGAEPLPG
jgi:hypothetical protein